MASFSCKPHERNAIFSVLTPKEFLLSDRSVGWWVAYYVTATMLLQFHKALSLLTMQISTNIANFFLSLTHWEMVVSHLYKSTVIAKCCLLIYTVVFGFLLMYSFWVT